MKIKNWFQLYIWECYAIQKTKEHVLVDLFLTQFKKNLSYILIKNLFLKRRQITVLILTRCQAPSLTRVSWRSSWAFHKFYHVLSCCIAISWAFYKFYHGPCCTAICLHVSWTVLIVGRLAILATSKTFQEKKEEEFKCWEVGGKIYSRPFPCIRSPTFR